MKRQSAKFRLASIERRNHERRLLIAAEKTSRKARCQQPNIGPRVARTEAKRFLNVRLGLLGPTNEQLVLPDQRVSSSHIAIEGQGPFVFGDALGGSVGEAEDHAQGQVRKSVVGSQRQSLGRRSLGRGETHGFIACGQADREIGLNLRHARQRVDIGGIEGQCALEEAEPRAWLPGTAASSSTVACSAVSLMSQIVTRAPAAASFSAIRRPMPLAPPVTSACLPAMSLIARSL